MSYIYPNISLGIRFLKNSSAMFSMQAITSPSDQFACNLFTIKWVVCTLIYRLKCKQTLFPIAHPIHMSNLSLITSTLYHLLHQANLAFQCGSAVLINIRLDMRSFTQDAGMSPSSFIWHFHDYIMFVLHISFCTQ